MMPRFFVCAALFFLSAGTACADYILVKININQMNFFPGSMPLPALQQMGGVVAPPMPPMPGVAPKVPVNPFGGGFGGFQIMPDPANPQPGMPDDPNAKWLSAWVEVKGKPPIIGNIPGGMGCILQVDHKWGKRNWMPYAPTLYPFLGGYVENKFVKDFDADLKKGAKDKVKNIENLLHLARKALERGRLDKFHLVMKDAIDVDPRHPNVKTYVKVKKDLSQPFNDEDPAQQELIRELREANYKPHLSDQKHFCVYANYGLTDRYIEAAVKRRLVIMEETLESFYYWFAMQKVKPQQPVPMQPSMPRYRLAMLLTSSREEFLTRHQQWGLAPMVGDAFTPRRENIIVMATKPRVMDPVYQDFDTVVFPAKIQDANTRLKPYNVALSRDELLSGKINDPKSPAGQVAIYIGAIQTAQLLFKTIEDQAERATLSNEVVRQLLTASGMLPRNVTVPDWLIEGIAAYFETPAGAVYPASTNLPNSNHLISFIHLCRKRKDHANVLYNVVTDRYFQNARKLSAQSLESRDNNELRLAAREEWEMARCTAWAFVYYLAENSELDLLFRYGKELDTLPRDLDLSDGIMQRSFAKAFDMADRKDPRRIAALPLSNKADSWFQLMAEATLIGVPAEVQTYFLLERAKREGPGTTSSVETPMPK